MISPLSHGALACHCPCLTPGQVNLDFANEADMVAKLRLGLALQPVATALFANSPFKLGHPTGFRSVLLSVLTITVC